ncbi:MAG TPA: tetratricopeptide repeat protein [Acidimicrobiales bacterium]|nr:tetratricopeptide repeat protein [Acidimicrobiales bacterium]
MPTTVILVLVIQAALISNYRDAAQQALLTGLAAEARGDCPGALASYRRLTTVYELTLSEDVVVAQRQSFGCEQVLEAAQARTDGAFGRAVTLYNAVLRERPDSVLVSHVRRWRTETYMEWGSRLRDLREYQQAADLYRQLPTDSFDEESISRLVADTYLEWGDELLSAGDHKRAIEKYQVVRTQLGDVSAVAESARARLTDIVQGARASIEKGMPCEALPILDALVTAEEPFRGDALRLTPGALFSCGEQSHEKGQFREAATHFRALLERFPDSDLAALAEAARVDSEVAAARGQTTSPLPPPPPTGRAPSGSAVLIVQNDSPRPIEVLVSGPSSKRISLEPCAGCSEVISQLGCTGKGPLVEVVLEPGEYEVLARVTDGTTVTPFTGTWSLSGATRYSHCLYIQRVF